MSRQMQYLVVLGLAFIFSGHPSQADTWTWDGESPSTESWSDWTNWVGDSSAPVSDPGTDLIFGNSSHVFSSNNMGLFQLRDLTFVGSTSPHILGDNLQVFRSIVNSSSVDRGILAPITLGADATFRAANGGLQFAGTIDNAGNVLTIEGDSAVQMASLSGSGRLDIHGPGQTTLWGSNAYSGATHVYGGTLMALAPDALRNSTSLLVQGSSTAILSMDSGFFAAESAGRQARAIGPDALLNLTAMTVGGTSNTLSVSGGGRAEAGMLSLWGETYSILVQDPGSRLDAGHEFGMGGSGGRLWVTEGGNVGSELMYVTSSVAHVLVSGSGSSITGTALIASSPGTGNAIEARDGGDMHFSAGVAFDGHCNTIRVHGANAQFRTPNLYIGNMSSAFGNHIVISNGGRLDATIITSAAASNTLISVSDAGSVIGQYSGSPSVLALQGTDERLEVRDGATLFASPFIVGTRETFDVHGIGSSVTGASPSQVVGLENTFTVSGGARVDLPSFTMGGNGNQLEVTGTGTMWTNPGVFDISGGPQNSLRVTDGAEFLTGSLSMMDATDLNILFSGTNTRAVTENIIGNLMGDSSITISNGAQVSSSEAMLVGPTARLDVVGTGSAFHVAGELGIGIPTRIADGAQLSSFSAVSIVGVELAGAGTVWSNRGDFSDLGGTCELTITGGAHVFHGGNVSLPTASVIVEGPGSQLEIRGDTTLWSTINVLNGGQMYSSDTMLSANSGRVDISGANTLWNNSGTLSIGAGNGVDNVVQVSTGGVLNSGVIEVGHSSQDDNELRVLDGGHVSSDFLTIGAGGRLLLNGGELTVNTLSKTSAISGGTFDFHSGTLNVSSTMYHSLPPFDVGDGTQTAVLNLAGSSEDQHTFTGGLRIRERSGLIGEGTIHGDVYVEGMLSVGHSAGDMTIEGDVTFDNSAEVYMEIFGEDDGEYDRLLADSISYNGFLQVTFSGFTPMDGSRYQLFDTASYSGSFAATNIMGVFSAGFDAESGEVFVIQAIPEANTFILLLGGIALLSRRRKR